MKRRTFLTAAAVAATGTSLPAAEFPTAPVVPGDLIDTNVTLHSWAIRRSSAASPALLVQKLRHHGVVSAWTGSFEGVLHSDMAGANERLAQACAQEGGGILRPFGTVNPTLPDWEDDLRRCHELHRMPGVRLFPNYHRYGLDDARFARLLELATQRRLLVQIALMLEDDRSQNPMLTAAPVQAAPLVETISRVQGARVMLLNSGSRVLGTGAPLLQRLTNAGVLFELATLEGVAGLEHALKNVPAIRIAFGSHSPYFYFESALLKLQESLLTSAQLADIRHGHARAALG